MLGWRAGEDRKLGGHMFSPLTHQNFISPIWRENRGDANSCNQCLNYFLLLRGFSCYFLTSFSLFFVFLFFFAFLGVDMLVSHQNFIPPILRENRGDANSCSQWLSYSLSPVTWIFFLLSHFFLSLSFFLFVAFLGVDMLVAFFFSWAWYSHASFVLIILFFFGFNYTCIFLFFYVFFGNEFFNNKFGWFFYIFFSCLILFCFNWVSFFNKVIWVNL